MDLIALQRELARDEGSRRFRYQDTLGYWTIGIGHNIDADRDYPHTRANEPLTDQQITDLFWSDIRKVIADLDRALPWYTTMSDARQRVLANMCFNLGLTKLLGFKNTLRHMQNGHYLSAAQGMRASLWAKQVKGRAERLAVMMERGV